VTRFLISVSGAPAPGLPRRHAVADEAALELLVSRIASCPIRVHIICALRLPDVAERGPLADALEELATSGGYAPRAYRASGAGCACLIPVTEDAAASTSHRRESALRLPALKSDVPGTTASARSMSWMLTAQIGSSEPAVPSRPLHRIAYGREPRFGSQQAAQVSAEETAAVVDEAISAHVLRGDPMGARAVRDHVSQALVTALLSVSALGSRAHRRRSRGAVDDRADRHALSSRHTTPPPRPARRRSGGVRPLAESSLARHASRSVALLPRRLRVGRRSI